MLFNVKLDPGSFLLRGCWWQDMDSYTPQTRTHARAGHRGHFPPE